MVEMHSSQKTVLLTGATGYIGRRLKRQLLACSNFNLRLLVRTPAKIDAQTAAKVEVYQGDTLDRASLDAALQGVDIAYYLIHSMGDKGDFVAREKASAENFRDACIAAGVQRIIYLGGLGSPETASKHLASRHSTGEILSALPEQIQTIWFRAGVIIGAGSASFEIIRSLVEKLPIMITPRWVRTATQPIAVADVLRYLQAALHREQGQGESLCIDIGAEKLSFQEMMLKTAQVMGLRRFLFPVPVLSPKLSSYWLILFTSTPYSLASLLVEGLKSETVLLNDNAQQYFPEITPRSYEQAVQEALLETEEDKVISRWCDTDGSEPCDLQSDPHNTTVVFRDVQEVPLGQANATDVFTSVCTIGGKNGWYQYTFLWQLRGLIDKLQGGYGLNRGRRSSGALRVGDALDFWKVADLRPEKRLLLVAEMKLPGKAWLEFSLQNNTLIQTAHFIPRGLLGRIYWYAVWPFHLLIFKKMAQTIVERAETKEASPSGDDT